MSMILLPTSETRRRDFLLKALGGAALLAAPRPVLAQDTGSPGGKSAVIDVANARNAPIPVAITDLGGGPLGANLSAIVTNDLARSGLFRPIDRAAFIQSGASDTGTPNFENWKPTGAQALVTGQASDDGSQVRVEFRLWDILPQTQIQGTAFTAPRANWRRVGHIMADALYQRLLGEKGYFDTRVVYVSGVGPKAQRVRRLAVMDQDSENQRYLSDGSWLALTPRFSPRSDQIVFMSYANNQPRVYLMNVATRRAIVTGTIRFDDVLTAVFARRRDGRDVANRGRRIGHHRGQRRFCAAVDELGRDRRQPVLQPGWIEDRVRFGSRRGPADLPDGYRRRRREADQLRQWPLWHAGVVAARRSDRVHALCRGYLELRHRGDAAGWLGRADPGRGLGCRRPDLRAERSRADVLA